METLKCLYCLGEMIIDKAVFSFCSYFLSSKVISVYIRDIYCPEILTVIIANRKQSSQPQHGWSGSFDLLSWDFTVLCD